MSTAVQLFVCPERGCGREFSSAPALNMHRQRAHGGMLTWNQKQAQAKNGAAESPPAVRRCLRKLLSKTQHQAVRAKYQAELRLSHRSGGKGVPGGEWGIAERLGFIGGSPTAPATRTDALQPPQAAPGRDPSDREAQKERARQMLSQGFSVLAIKRELGLSSYIITKIRDTTPAPSPQSNGHAPAPSVIVQACALKYCPECGMNLTRVIKALEIMDRVDKRG